MLAHLGDQASTNSQHPSSAALVAKAEVKEDPEFAHLMDKPESSDEVQDRMAEMPHPKVLVSSLFLVALALLLLADGTFLNPPDFGASTRVIEEHINICMKDFQHDNATGFMASMHEWVKGTPWKRIDDTDTKLFYECLPAITQVTFLYRYSKLKPPFDNHLWIAFVAVKCNDLTDVPQPSALQCGTEDMMELTDDLRRFSFPRALYFSFTMQSPTGSKYVAVTQMLTDFRLKRSFNHRCVPMSGEKPLLGLLTTGFAAPLYVCGMLTLLATAIHCYFERQLWRTWAIDIPRDLQTGEKGTRVLFIGVEVTCVVITFVTAGIGPEYLFTKDGHLRWNGGSANRSENYRLLVFVLQLGYIVPILDGARYCGHRFLSIGCPVVCALGCIFTLLVAAMESSKRNRPTLAIDSFLVGNTLILATLIFTLLLTGRRHSRVRFLETKHFWVTNRKNYDLKLTREAIAFIGFTWFCRVSALALAVAGHVSGTGHHPWFAVVMESIVRVYEDIKWWNEQDKEVQLNVIFAHFCGLAIAILLALATRATR